MIPLHADSVQIVQNFVLSERPAGTSAYPSGHYLIPDTNIFLYCMDIIEHESAFYDVIVLQTVLEEVRNRSLPLYNRLRALTKGDKKRFYVFHNEFRQETHVKRLQEEIINDHNDRLVRKACSWYKSHLATALAGTPNKVPEIVMLSDDRDNLRKAKSEGIACCNSMLIFFSFFAPRTSKKIVCLSTARPLGYFRIYIP